MIPKVIPKVIPGALLLYRDAKRDTRSDTKSDTASLAPTHDVYIYIYVRHTFNFLHIPESGEAPSGESSAGNPVGQAPKSPPRKKHRRPGQRKRRKEESLLEGGQKYPMRGNES